MLVSRDEVCKVADFGLSREVIDDEYNVQRVSANTLPCGDVYIRTLLCREARYLFAGLPLRLFTDVNSLQVVTCGALVC